MNRQQALEQRQVLVAIGNRYVIFGPTEGLPPALYFDAERDAEMLPRVADEYEVDESRIIQTLRVHDMQCKISHGDNAAVADLMLTTQQGEQIWVDVKVREHSPKRRDLDAAYKRIQDGLKEGKTVEVWHFNVERLSLLIQAYDGGMPIYSELPPLDVWEKTGNGIFRRERVVESVIAWEKRIDELYANVEHWLQGRTGLTCDRSRTVTMSEGLMQRFAVADRELSVLDVLGLDGVIASFVPRALWVIGSRGRVDVITKAHTRLLVVHEDDAGAYEWRIVAPDNRTQTSELTKDALMSLLELP